ncbi:MAG TPA: SdrD B-like domain-containing protein, partial [Puia sp.]|nr:SdrD B-like domain-containing protein [Puia sp.]
NSTPDHYTAPQQSSPAFTLPTSQSTVTVRVLDACLNSGTKTVAITKATAPIIRSTVFPLTTCSYPFSFSLYIDSLYDGSVFQWTKVSGSGSGNTIIGTSPSLPLTYNSIADTGTYQVTVTVPNTCYNVSSVFYATVTTTCSPSVSGNVFDDANGLTDGTVNGTGTNAGGVYVKLVNSSNNVIATAQVATDGTYKFLNVSAGTYSLVLSTVSGSSTSASLPSGWVNTGENMGAGNDGNVNGILSNIIIGSSSISNLNFGIEQKPTADNITAASQVNPGTTKTVQVVTLNGNDAEDGTYDGISLINTVVINTLPSNAILYYNGTKVNAGDTIRNYSPSSLMIDPNDGAITAIFTYSEIDAAGISSSPATVNMPFLILSTLPIRFINFNVITIGTSAKLDWQAATDGNASSFIVEHSTDGKIFVKIGEVNSQIGNDSKSYSLIDMAPAFGTNYYRIKMIDDLGNYTYSDVKAVTFSDEYSKGVKIYPVPANSFTQLQLPKVAEDGMYLQVYDNQDRLMTTMQANHRMIIPINVSSFASGIYTVKVFRSGVSVYTGRIIKL